MKRWRDDEKQWIEFINGVNFSTKYNTPMDRLDRLDRAEQLFKTLKIPYSIYNRGLYLELKDEIEKKKSEEFFNQYPELRDLI